MTGYLGESDFDHGESAAVGVLLTNVGSPAAPTTGALREYLKQFLSDPRVIENQGLSWKLVLHGLILRIRPRQSAKAYREVWTDEGSPLLNTVRSQARGVGALLRARIGSPIHVAVGMGYGSPSVDHALGELKEKGCHRILVMPLFPQYASATVGSTFDAVARTLSGWRWVPELRMITHYHDNQAYIKALTRSVKDFWAEKGEPQRLLLSFHGLPVRTLTAGDPYHCQCQKTARLFKEALEFPDERIYLTFQSRFGREEWLQPYTEDVLRQLGGGGVRRLVAVCPGFAADCLETLDEIGSEGALQFREGGGHELHLAPCVNSHPVWLDAMAEIARQETAGWVS